MNAVSWEDAALLLFSFFYFVLAEAFLLLVGYDKLSEALFSGRMRNVAMTLLWWLPLSLFVLALIIVTGLLIVYSPVNGSF